MTTERERDRERKRGIERGRKKESERKRGREKEREWERKRRREKEREREGGRGSAGGGLCRKRAPTSAACSKRRAAKLFNSSANLTSSASLNLSAIAFVSSAGWQLEQRSRQLELLSAYDFIVLRAGSLSCCQHTQYTRDEALSYKCLRS